MNIISKLLPAAYKYLAVIKERKYKGKMLEWFIGISPVMQAFIATCFTYLMTALGAAVVFFFKKINKKVLNLMLGFAAGVMIAASFWSLLAPAIEMSAGGKLPAWLVVSIGFALGGGFLFALDKTLPHLHAGLPENEAEGIHTQWKRSVLLMLAITLHNIPEGLAVGVAFGAAAAGLPGATIISAVVLAVGIGIQNFPEGAAVSIPLRREGLSRRKAFMHGQFSGIVEPVAGIIGAVMVIKMQAILPYALAFAAGAMIYVVVEELLPTASRGEHSDFSTIGALAGFIIMMILDVALG